ncbi:MAG TPA: hypothetical protein VIM11_04985 [Tepidisphaeraceae bacterium]|jgi:hypothetical protein
MNLFRMTLFALSLSLSGMTARAQESAANRPRGPEIVNLTLHRQAATRPALQFKLLPDITDQRPGNGAGLYLAASRVGPDPKAADELSGRLGDRFRDLPMDQLAASDLVSALQPFAERLDMLDLAARREDARWESTIRDWGAVASLAYLTDMRVNARILSLKARGQIARHDWKAAHHTLQTAFSMAHQMNDRAVLIQGLIETGIADLLLDRIVEWSGQGDAPNLYWPLTDLPAPFIDLRAISQWEQAMVYFTYPPLSATAPEQLSAEQWKNIFAGFDRLMQSYGQKPITPLQLSWLIASTHPKAKEALLADGMSAAKVDSLSIDQVVGIYLFRQYVAASDDAWKDWELPLWQGAGRVPILNSDWETRREREAENPFLALIPMVNNARYQFARVDRKVCALRIIESIRDFAASHEGHFPGSLDELTTLPVSIDPVTGKPFPYRLDGNTAVLESLPENPKYPATGTQYHLTIAH